MEKESEVRCPEDEICITCEVLYRCCEHDERVGNAHSEDVGESTPLLSITFFFTITCVDRRVAHSMDECTSVILGLGTLAALLIGDFMAHCRSGPSAPLPTIEDVGRLLDYVRCLRNAMSAVRTAHPRLCSPSCLTDMDSDIGGCVSRRCAREAGADGGMQMCAALRRASS